MYVSVILFIAWNSCHFSSTSSILFTEFYGTLLNKWWLSGLPSFCLQCLKLKLLSMKTLTLHAIQCLTWTYKDFLSSCCCNMKNGHPHHHPYYITHHSWPLCMYMSNVKYGNLTNHVNFKVITKNFEFWMNLGLIHLDKSCSNIVCCCKDFCLHIHCKTAHAFVWEASVRETMGLQLKDSVSL